MEAKVDFRPIILAGGSGTRFWPRSRRSKAKQVLALNGERSMIQMTADRLAKLARPQDLWVITNELLAGMIAQQLEGLQAGHILCEPVARNTAPAAGLAAFLLERIAPEAVLGIFPADQVVADEEGFRAIIEQGIALAAAGENIVVLGIKPTRPETGYGYIESGEVLAGNVTRVRRFTEKPSRERAEEFLRQGTTAGTAACFCGVRAPWRMPSVNTFQKRRRFSKRLPLLLEGPDLSRSSPSFIPAAKTSASTMPFSSPRSSKGEHRSNLYCLPAEFGWSDLGSWAALYEHQLGEYGSQERNVVEAAGSLALDAHGNYVYSRE